MNPTTTINNVNTVVDDMIVNIRTIYNQLDDANKVSTNTVHVHIIVLCSICYQHQPTTSLITDYSLVIKPAAGTVGMSTGFGCNGQFGCIVDYMTCCLCITTTMMYSYHITIQ